MAQVRARFERSGRVASSEDVIGLNLQKGDRNHVRVILTCDDNAHLYINDRRMSILNFSLGDIPAPDRVGLVIDDRDGQGFPLQPRRPHQV